MKVALVAKSATNSAFIARSIHSRVVANVPRYAEAQVDTAKGALVTTTPIVETWSPGGPNAIPKGVFHSFDFPFFHVEVQADAQQRVAAFLATH